MIEPVEMRRRIAIVAAPLAFAEIVAGQAQPTPLLPVYDHDLGLGPAGVGLVFTAYFVVLLVVLGVMARPRMQHRPGLALVAALGFSVAADVALSIHSFEALIVARVLTGLAVGFGTGAAAALVLSLIGERGRTVTATGNSIGAVLGAGIAITAYQVWGQIGPGYAIHGVITAATLVALLLVLPRMGGPEAASVAEGTVVIVSDAPGGSTWTGYLCGAISWIGPTIVLAFLPISIAEQFGWDSFLVSIAVIVVFVGAATGQFLLYSAERIRRTTLFTATAHAGGLGLLVAGVTLGSLPLDLVACLLIGLSQGSGYRLGLRIVTRGASPVRQGALAARYAWSSYASTAVVIGIVGIISGPLGREPGLVGSAAILIPVTIAIGILIAANTAPSSSAP